jgi:hypothetical protein
LVHVVNQDELASRLGRPAIVIIAFISITITTTAYKRH